MLHAFGVEFSEPRTATYSSHQISGSFEWHDPVSESTPSDQNCLQTSQSITRARDRAMQTQKAKHPVCITFGLAGSHVRVFLPFLGRFKREFSGPSETDITAYGDSDNESDLFISATQISYKCSIRRRTKSCPSSDELAPV